MTENSADTTETVATFEALAAMMYAADDYGDIYRSICEAAVRLVDGCDHASLMLLRRGESYTAAATDDVAEHIDALERAIGDGPCLDAITDEAAYVDADLTDGSPWPGLDHRVMAETPVRGMAGFRLINAGQKTGALNLFSDTPGALTQRSVDQAILLVSFVSVALLAAQEKLSAATLRAGLASNREIGKAVGLMMAFHHVDDETAFSILRQASQDMNLKLVEVAREIIAHQNARRPDAP
jgi:hypothetical protein